MFRYALPAILWTLVVTILTLLPGKDLPEINLINFDKFAHIGVFGLLNLLYLRWLRQDFQPITSALVITSCIISYGGLIEILQGILYIDRHADWADFGANTFGCMLAWLLFSYLPKQLR